ncbi:2-succinyl-6-hydroxy-2,4-cyclohexadiene-1-carboxylate synthase [Salimicrobium flavidum]|uniref:Putative 2-succinyl-6-hydroxy-2,4-cyclohexadiene-1-carboxylate synthase n=1 Tax=Salimicrobium flavidum TaxID=570947 RepID=A0A1N7J3T9_9BACI|nr:2-succinyl-6-hydroxy-2,4-cyclohexadiene-1-carboxylate synthase [Salimicrobium flavidum]SIS44025.1 2-succinyl-6-hydroxy-2,4-cyclohexadiene-1-carboxylate synthase [Salimicrobium flavidum]
MYLTARNREYWVEDEGKGPPLCFLHGFTGSTAIWKETKRAFPDFRLILVDLPGHGKTGDVGVVSMEEVAEDLKVIFEKLQLPKLSLLGYSMGGRTALYFALHHPEMVDRLILESASPGLKTEEERQERIKKDEKVSALLENEGIEGFTNRWEDLPLFETVRSLPFHRRQSLRKQRLYNDPTGLTHSLQGMGTGTQPSLWRHLRDIGLPVCLIVGGEDGKYVKINREMEKGFARAEMHEIEGAGHIPHLEKPDIFSEIIRRFMI